MGVKLLLLLHPLLYPTLLFPQPTDQPSLFLCLSRLPPLLPRASRNRLLLLLLRRSKQVDLLPLRSFTGWLTLSSSKPHISWFQVCLSYYNIWISDTNFYLSSRSHAKRQHHKHYITLILSWSVLSSHDFWIQIWNWRLLSIQYMPNPSLYCGLIWCDHTESLFSLQHRYVQCKEMFYSLNGPILCAA